MAIHTFPSAYLSDVAAQTRVCRAGPGIREARLKLCLRSVASRVILDQSFHFSQASETKEKASDDADRPSLQLIMLGSSPESYSGSPGQEAPEKACPVVASCLIMGCASQRTPTPHLFCLLEGLKVKNIPGGFSTLQDGGFPSQLHVWWAPSVQQG